MRSTKVLITVLLSIPMAFAQRGGAMGRGGGPVLARPAPPVRSGGPIVAPGLGRGVHRGPTIESGRGYRRHFGYGSGYFWPYAPIWDYSSVTPLYYNESPGPYSEEYPAENELSEGPPGMAGPGVFPMLPPKPATSVIHEYNFGNPAPVVAESAASFTIVLTDGSTRSAVASWVQDGKLHYMDLQSRSQVLATDVIDRTATERANASKNLRMELPPG